MTPLRQRLRAPPPDKVVKKDEPADYTGSGPVADRVLVINLGFFKYGTNDRFQGAALLLATLLLFLVLLLIIASVVVDIPDARFGEVFQWLGGTFLLVTGVAIGRATSGRSD